MKGSRIHGIVRELKNENIDVINFTTNPSLYIQRAAEVIQEGGIIAYPTDTVYGMGADPLNPRAVQEVFAIKQRDGDRGLPILLPDMEDALRIGQFQDIELLLCKKFWPGPLTIVVKKIPPGELIIDPIVTGGSDSIALRIPSHPIIHAICKQLKDLSGFGAIIGTSANFSGESSITSGKRIVEEFSNIIDFIIEKGDCEENIPSTVVQIDYSQNTIEDKVQILRKGKISKEQILKTLVENL